MDSRAEDARSKLKKNAEGKGKSAGTIDGKREKEEETRTELI